MLTGNQGNCPHVQEDWPEQGPAALSLCFGIMALVREWRNGESMSSFEQIMFPSALIRGSGYRVTTYHIVNSEKQ